MDEHYETLARDKLIAVIVPTSCNGQQTLHISKALLCSASDYFFKALNGGFSEINTSTINLYGDDPTAVMVFTHWLIHRQLPDFEDMCKADDTMYTHRLETTAEHSQAINSPESIDECVKLLELRTFIFGDKYGISKLQKDILKTLPISGWASSFTVIQELFAAGPALKKVQRAVVREIAFGLANGYSDRDNRQTLGHMPWLVDRYNAILGFPDCFANVCARFIASLACYTITHFDMDVEGAFLAVLGEHYIDVVDLI